MSIRDLAPWNWGKKEPAIRHGNENPVATLQHEMNRIFDSFWKGDFPMLRGFGSDLGTNWPALNLRDTGKELVVEAEMPGMAEKDIDVSIHRHELTIRGERHEEKTSGEGECTWSERSYGSFHRTIPLGTEIDADHAEAKLKDGILTLTLPKLHPEAETHKRISVHAAEKN